MDFSARASHERRRSHQAPPVLYATALLLDSTSNQVLVDLAVLDLRTYIAEPDRGRRRWTRKAAARDAVYANRRRIRGARGRALQRHRSERLERPNAHLYETGGMRADASARARQHRETALGTHRWLQSRTLDAHAHRRRNPTRPAGTVGGADGHRHHVVDVRRRLLASPPDPFRRSLGWIHAASLFRAATRRHVRRSLLATGS